MVTGSGTSGDPYVLSTFSELELIGSDATYTLAKYYKLGANIDASPTQDPGYNAGAGWSPRGNATTKFTGGFDGNGYSIDGLYINRGTTDNVGLFGYINTNNVKNVTITNCDIYGQNYVGAVSGHSDSITITNSTVTGSIEGTLDYVGGVLGRHYASSGGIATANVDATITGRDNVGGVLGASPRANNVYTCVISNITVDVTVNGRTQVGGVCGYQSNGGSSGIYNVTGTVVINGTGSAIGGIVGKLLRYVHDAVINLTINATGCDSVGGVVGTTHYNSHTIYDNEITGEITGRDNVGGIIGSGGANTSYVTNIYGNTTNLTINGVNNVGGAMGAGNNRGNGVHENDLNGTINATGNSIGGVVGYGTITVYNQDNDNVVINASATSNNVGGIYGYNYYGVSIQNCKNYMDISGQDGIGGILGNTVTNTAFATHISNCRNDGDISGRSQVGGIYGACVTNQTAGTISKNFNQGNITGTGSNIGGCFGYYRGTGSNCYSIGTVSGGSVVGGLIGTRNGGTIINSYSIGAVSGSATVGGFCGSGGGASDTDNFWDTETSGQASSSIGTGKTTAELHDQATYTNWDFSTPIWRMMPCANEGYPFLQELPVRCVIIDAGGLDSTFQFGCDAS